MTWLWIALIVVGAAMIAFALWPSRRGKGAAAQDERDGTAMTAERPDHS